MTSVSITIPCLNEEKYIGICLESIVKCNYSKDFLKVYVVDGLSSDGTLAIVEEYSKNYPFIKILCNPEKITPISLNIGIKACNSDVAIILGAHAEIHPNYIEECLLAFEVDSNIACVGGLLEQFNEDQESKIIGMAMSSPFGVGNAHFRTGAKEGFVDTVAFGAYKREVFESVGYFDEELARNQDDEFNFRVIKGGFNIYLSHNIRAKYYVRASYRKLFRQYFQYGFWKVLVNKKHKTITSLRQLIPPVFVGGTILGVFGTLFSPSLLISLLLCWGTYVLAAIYCAIKISKRSFLFRICVAFLILHIAYGSGYLKGIVHFIILNKSPQRKHQKLSR